MRQQGRIGLGAICVVRAVESGLPAVFGAQGIGQPGARSLKHACAQPG